MVGWDKGGIHSEYERGRLGDQMCLKPILLHGTLKILWQDSNTT